jgi:Icc-related predicted phosphoesterase
MRIAFVVDVHGRSELVAAALAEIGEIDLLVVGGDITQGGSPEDAGTAVEQWRRLVPNLLAVAGNMDSPAIDARLDELGVALDGRGVVFGEAGFFGVSAAPFSPLETPYELPEEEIERRIERAFADVTAARIRIFCPHTPPHGTACDRLESGEHVGSEAVRRFIDREQPELVLCGHIHESRAMDQVGRSRIVNPGPLAAGHYATADLQRGPSVRMCSLAAAD